MCNNSVETCYQQWLDHMSENGRAELLGLSDQEREDAFYCDLAFGTGGLRGKLGLGSNRMNTYTVGKATQGLADYLNANFEQPSVALCRDTRHGSKEFVRRVAEVLAGNGIRSFLYERVEPTPALSFAVRELGCSAGVNITASHNPAAYNGYKVYGADGCQITVDAATAIQAAIGLVDCFDGVKAMPFDDALAQGLVQWTPQRVLDRYLEETLTCSTGENCRDLKVVYTPLHGVGLECVSRVLESIHVAQVTKVEEQCVLNGDFPTCPYPNPEIREALELGLSYCSKVQPDLLLATDPDADRVGIAVPHEGEYKLLTGNEVGLLLLDFLAKKAADAGENLSHKVACTTIVSAPMADALATAHGFELRRTLTGFKFIGEQVGMLEQQGRADDFLMGFEESYGYLVGTSVRDKDAVVASMLICELAAYWKSQGQNLYEAMQGLYETYGFWASTLYNQAYEGPQGAEDMAHMMSSLRTNAPSAFAGTPVHRMVDYAQGVRMPCVNALVDATESVPAEASKNTCAKTAESACANTCAKTADTQAADTQVLPAADVVEFLLSDESRVLFRPSGTEPKAKAYVFAKGASAPEAQAKLAAIGAAAQAILEGKIA